MQIQGPHVTIIIIIVIVIIINNMNEKIHIFPSELELLFVFEHHFDLWPYPPCPHITPPADRQVLSRLQPLRLHGNSETTYTEGSLSPKITSWRPARFCSAYRQSEVRGQLGEGWWIGAIYQYKEGVVH